MRNVYNCCISRAEEERKSYNLRNNCQLRIVKDNIFRKVFNSVLDIYIYRKKKRKHFRVNIVAFQHVSACRVITRPSFSFSKNSFTRKDTRKIVETIIKNKILFHLLTIEIPSLYFSLLTAYHIPNRGPQNIACVTISLAIFHHPNRTQSPSQLQ